MISICHPDIWIEFIQCASKVNCSIPQLLLCQAIKNPNNKFSYYHEWDEFYNSKLETIDSETVDFVDVYHNVILIDLNNQNRLEPEISSKISNDSDFIKIFTASTKINFAFLKNHLTLPATLPRCVGILDLVKKPNRHWTYFSLWSGNGVNEAKLTYSDFPSNEAIQDFVSDILNLKNPVDQKIFIQSDYMNFGDIFSKVIGKKINYCTTKICGTYRKRHTDLINEKSDVKTYFGNNSIFSVTDKKSILHPRAIVHGNIVATLNHDFDQIHIANSNWIITFQYSVADFSDKLTLLASYIEIN